VTCDAGMLFLVAELERTGLRLALRYGGCVGNEPNDSMLEGAGMLDDYLNTHYIRALDIGAFQVWRRVADPSRGG
jgi:hypothetical protein